MQIAIEGGKPIREKFLPYATPWIEEDEIDEVKDILQSLWITTGPKVVDFEEAFKAYIGTRFALALNSCTAALHVGLLSAGIKPGDEVITTPITFCATSNAVLYIGAKPVFVDVENDTLNIDPEKIEERITKKTRAILPVHYAGQPVDLDRIFEIAKHYRLFVIEDAAHALSAEYKGRKIGTFGDITCFSFHAVKNLTTAEGGMITTDNEHIANQVTALRNHGISADAYRRLSEGGRWQYEMTHLGFKYNMTDIQAALGLVQLKKLSFFQARREEIVKRYTEAFMAIPQIEPLAKRAYTTKHAWHLYVIKLKQERLKVGRDRILDALRHENIGVNLHYMPVYLHPYYRERFGYKENNCPIAEEASRTIITLPLFPKMSDKDVDDVICAIERVVRYYQR